MSAKWKDKSRFGKFSEVIPGEIFLKNLSNKPGKNFFFWTEVIEALSQSNGQPWKSHNFTSQLPHPPLASHHAVVFCLHGQHLVLDRHRRLLWDGFSEVDAGVEDQFVTIQPLTQSSLRNDRHVEQNQMCLHHLSSPPSLLCNSCVSRYLFLFFFFLGWWRYFWKCCQ